MKESYFWVSVLGFGVVSVSEVVGVEADYAALVVGDSAVNFDVGVHLNHVGKIKPWVVFWQFDVAVDGERPHLCHAVDAPVGEVSGGVVGDAVEGVGHWFLLSWMMLYARSVTPARMMRWSRMLMGSSLPLSCQPQSAAV